MNRIKVLDCTLRDGGYCNGWNFGFNRIKEIVRCLVDANIDIIECGFLTSKVKYKKDVSKFTTLDEVKEVIPKEKKGKMYVCLLNYGEYNIDDIPICQNDSLDGIRVAFHKKDINEALEFCKRLKEKKYKVFVQPMVSLSYSDEEFLDLIRKVNKIKPYAFYIVDSFGAMKSKDLIRLFYNVEHNLEMHIHVGYHSHNNMQLAYSNAQTLVSIQTKRKLIIDASIFGMGRGAGNLNTELFVEYLNETESTHYKLKPILLVVDKILNRFYQQNYWGYSLPNYLSASHNVHPNYATYLNDKQTLTVEDMDAIFTAMQNDKKNNFNQEYIEELYIQYMNSGEENEEHFVLLKEELKDKNVLIIAPGKSSEEEKEKIIQYGKKKDVISISINYEYPYLDTNYIFISNLRRYRELNKNMLNRCIVTSNIHAEQAFLRPNYAKLMNEIDSVKDNAGMMLLQYLVMLDVKKVVIAGMDGYSHEVSCNYACDELKLMSPKAGWNAMNKGIEIMLKRFKSNVEIEFLTNSRYKNM